MDTEKSEELFERVERMLGEHNYVAAYTVVKKAEIAEDDRTELSGKIVTRLVDELSRCTRKEDRERAVYLRSLLAWIFRDIPGLASMYREQVRIANQRDDLAMDLYRGFKNFNDVASGRKSVSDGVQETMEGFQRNIDEAAERVRSGEADEVVRDFANMAEEGIKQGLSSLGKIFETLNQPRESARGDSRRSERPSSTDESEEDQSSSRTGRDKSEESARSSEAQSSEQRSGSREKAEPGSGEGSFTQRMRQEAEDAEFEEES